MKLSEFFGRWLHRFKDTHCIEAMGGPWDGAELWVGGDVLPKEVVIDGLRHAVDVELDSDGFVDSIVMIALKERV